MPRLPLLLLALAATAAGCSRYKTRGQAPANHNRQTRPASAIPPQNLPAEPGNRSGLSIPAAPAATGPKPAGFDEPQMVRGSAPGQAPNGGYGPRQVAAIEPATPGMPDAGNDPSRRQRRNGPDPAMPSPFAPQQPAAPAPAAAPAVTATPAPPSANAAPAASDPLAAVRKVAATAVRKWETVDSYEARMTRREVVKGDEGPVEEVIFRFRKSPFSIYMQNVGEAGKGREVLYVQGQNGDKMTVVTGAGDGFRGLKLALSPDDPKVTSKSRHTIREAGFGNGIARFARTLEAIDAGRVPATTLRPFGRITRTDYPSPLELVEQTIHPGEDPLLPKGGSRQWFFDPTPESPSHGLPVLAITRDAAGREVEYYRFTDVRTPLSDDVLRTAFDPERMGKKR